MRRLSRSAAAGFLTIVLCLGVSAGPALADDQQPADPTSTVAPALPETSPVPDTPPAPTPVVTEPAAPAPVEPEPAAPSSSEPATTTPAPSSEMVVQELADLRLRVWFEKPSYRADEDILVHAAVTNTGTTTANKVVLSWTGNLDISWWRPFHLYGVPIEPGHTVEGTTSDGRLSKDEEAVRLVVTVRQYDGEADAHPEDNTVTVSVPVVIPRGSFRATIYGDRDGDHVMDPGEALSGVTLHFQGGFPQTYRTTTTGEDGVAEFRNLPAGPYINIVIWFRSGWYVPTWHGVVDGVDDPDVVLRAIPELTDRLTASVTLTQTEYQSGDVPRAVLTLHNTGTVLLTDLTADCGDADVGELTPNGTGVALRPGETRAFTITKAPISRWEWWYGYVRLYCLVGAPIYSNGGWQGDALARVLAPVAPRVAGALSVQKYQPPLGPPSGVRLPGVKIYLRDQFDGTIVARDITNANGEFTFYNVRPGLYHVGVVGPWQVGYGAPLLVSAGENGSSHHEVFVVPGPYQPDPDPPSPPPGGGSAPPPPVAEEPELAATGANVTWLALGGLLSLITGAGMVLRTRPARR
ncbi:hypothetical protein ABZ345_37815 [Lentzea sp. NPDC005914]|uniref:MSCRAMM family protein n=1 Tax=Lentzea sp. NPDC005914 TaxID=3154572 RepID=UPI0033E7ECEE